MGGGQVTLLGRLAAIGEDQRTIDLDLQGHRNQVVFAVLVLGAGAPVSREALVTAVWDQDPPPTWSSALRSAITAARRALARCPSLTQAGVERGVDGWRLVLSPDVSVDVRGLLTSVDMMEDLLAADPAATLAAALHCRSIAERTFLPGVSGGWAESWRDRVTDALLAALQAEAAAASALGLPTQGRRAIEQAIALEPLNERSHLLLIRTLLAEGAASSAVRAFHAFRASVLEELGVEPGPSLHAAYLDALHLHAAATGHPDAAVLTVNGSLSTKAPDADFSRRALLSRAEAATAHGDYRDATACYRAALERIEPDDPTADAETAALQSALADSLDRTGDLAVADRLRFDAASTARRIADPTVLADVALGFGSISPPWLEHDHRRIVALFQEALDVLGTQHPSHRARLTSRCVAWMTWTHPRETRQRMGVEASELARRCDDPGTIIAVLADRGFVPQQRPHDVLITELAGRSLLDEFAALLGPELGFLAHSWISEGQLLRGELPGLRLTLRTLARYSEQQPTAHFCWRVAAMRSMDAVVRGDLEAAERDADRARAIGQDLPGASIDGVHVAQLLVIRWLQGRVAEMVTALEAHAEQTPDIDWRDVLAWLYAENGQLRSCRRLLHELKPDRFSADAAADPWVHWATNLKACARACALVGEPDVAAPVYRAFVQDGAFAMTATNVVCYGVVDHALTDLAVAMNRPDLAQRHRASARRSYQRMPAPLFVAALDREAAAVIRR